MNVFHFSFVTSARSRPHSNVPFPRSERSRAAFTLVEVMVAMAIFGLVMVAIYPSWTAILRGSKVRLTAAAEAQRSRVAVRAVREALTSAQLYGKTCATTGSWRIPPASLPP